MSQKIDQKPDPLRDLPPLDRLLMRPGIFLLKHETKIWVVLGLILLAAITRLLFVITPP